MSLNIKKRYATERVQVYRQAHRRDKVKTHPCQKVKTLKTNHRL